MARSKGRVCVKRRREEVKGRNDEEEEKWEIVDTYVRV